MTYRAETNTGSRGNNSETYGDILALKMRLGQLENENLALKTQVNQLIMSLSKTLLRGAVNS